MEQLRIDVVEEPQSDEIEFVTQQIINFNRNRAGEGNYKHLAIFLREAQANRNLIAYYQKHGFQPSHRSTLFYHFNRQDLKL